MYFNFKAVSLSYKTAPLAVRELAALQDTSCKLFLEQLKTVTDASDILVLSTCNRTEIYYTSNNDYSTDIIKLLSIQKGLADSNIIMPYFKSITDHNEAVQHLFDVAIGLESQVVGDMQIINQVKHAYQWSSDAGVAGPFLHRLLHTIFFANKKVVHETSFRDGAASVSYATVELVEELTADTHNPKILILGLGEIGADICRNFVNTDLSNITITNRTLAKAEALGQECNMAVVPFDQVWDEIAKADVIISSVGTTEPLITKEKISALNMLKHKFFIDLSVPRSIETSVEDVPGALLYNIDNINNRANEALNARIQSIPRVKEIIAEALAELNDWTKEMEVSPTIQKLKNALEQIRQEELARYVKQMDDQESQLVDKITKNIMQKIIKLPVLQLKAACKRGEADTLVDVLNDLFNLDNKHTV